MEGAAVVQPGIDVAQEICRRFRCVHGVDFDLNGAELRLDCNGDERGLRAENGGRQQKEKEREDRAGRPHCLLCRRFDVFAELVHLGSASGCPPLMCRES